MTPPNLENYISGVGLPTDISQGNREALEKNEVALFGGTSNQASADNILPPNENCTW